jgi:hypothetical protein
MHRTKIVGLIALLASGIAAAAMAMSKPSEGRRTVVVAAKPEREREADQGRLERELQRLRREVAELRAAQTTEPMPTARPQVVTPVPPPRRLRPDADTIERTHVENEAYVAAVASQMGAEPRDPSWSRAAEQHFSEAFRSHATPGTELVSVDCHTTGCGVTFQHDGPQGQRAVPHLVATSLNYAAEIVYAYSTDGAATTTAYISREGRHLAEH